MRDMMRSEHTPQLAHIRSVFSSAPSQLPDWKKRHDGGGVLLDLASHHFDLYRYALGKHVVEINARTADRKSEKDTAVVRAVFADGTVAESHFAFATVDEDRFELYFEGSKACFDRFRKTHAQSRSATFRYGRAAALGEGGTAMATVLSRLIRQPGEPSFAASLAAFIAAARGSGEPLADFEDGFASLALVDAAQRSAACGQSVRVEYPIE
jgi:predicted dehydrogenase